MLRQLTESTRQQTRARRRASGDRFRATRGTLVVLLSGRRVFGILITAARQKFFAHDLAVLHRVNANFGELEPLFGVFVCYVGVVLHHEAVVRDEWPIRFEAVDLHVLEPPIDLAADAILSFCLGRTAVHGARFHAHDVLVIQRIQRFMPRLFAPLFVQPVRYSSLFPLFELFVEEFFQSIENTVPTLVVTIA